MALEMHASTAVFHPEPFPEQLRFHDRTDAGRRLADALAPVLTPLAVVAAIPRGGVAIALPIVERLDLPLTVVHAHEAAVAPEFALGAVDEDGTIILDEPTVAALALQRADIEHATARAAADIRRRAVDWFRTCL